MDVEVTEQKDNPLLSRKEIQFSVKYEGPTPAFGQVREALIEKLKSNEKLTIVDSVLSEYGRQKAHGRAKVYESEEALAVEPRQRVAKNLEGKKKKKSGEAEETVSPPAAGEGEPKPPEKTREEKPPEKSGEEKPPEKAGEDKPPEKSGEDTPPKESGEVKGVQEDG